jgi:hypothetical protein
VNDEASLRSILEDLIDLFGWEDKTPLHAAIHVRNAVNNLRADLAVAQHHVATMTAKLDAAERSVTRAGMDDLLARVEQGARAVERDKIVAWLRTAPCDSPGHDPRWCQDCQVREHAADAIECGVHRNLFNNGDTKP